MKKRITPTIRNVFLITLIALFFIASTSFVSANNIVHKIADGTNNGFWVTTNIGLSHHTTCTAQGGGFVAVSPQSNAAATGEAIPQEFVDVAKTAGITNFNTIFKSGCWAGQNINCNNPNIYLPNPRTFHIGIFAYAQNQVIDADPTDLAYVHYCSLPNEPTTECSDGLDNDNDGLVDMYDPDCSNRDDDKEEPDTRQCNDNIDNDGDRLIDEEDPGCWDDTSDHTTYNPTRNNEAREDPMCVFNRDCGTNYHSENYCGNNDNVFRDFHRFTCTLDKTCEEEVIQQYVKTCQEGCTDGTCNEDREPQCADNTDNDNDGLTDAQDPGCWDDPLDRDTYNPELDDESRYTVTCTINTDCGNDIPFGNVCQGNDIFSFIVRPVCNNGGTGLSYCSADSILDFLETCPFGCVNGMCNAGECTDDTDCGEDYESELFCGADGNVHKELVDVSCGNDNTCGEERTDVLVETCTQGCMNGMCTNGGNDTVGPVVNLLKPLDGSTQSGDVTFEYTANDVGSGVAHCSLVVSDVIYQTEFNVDEMNANEFIQAFIEKNRSYTAKIVCTDNANNIGVSNEATFFYEDAIMCQDSSDCGDYSEELFCRNDDLYKEITNPRCVGNTCTVDITEELVRTCKNGCSDGRCNNGGGGGGNENDDDTDRIPIIVHATSIFDDTNVTQGDTGIIIATATPVLGAETKTTINWWVVILLLLIIGIILLLILIILAGFD